MRLLLDTHALVWWLMDDRRLGPARIRAIERSLAARERLGVAAISFWELAKLVEQERLVLPRSVDELFDDLDAHPQLAVLPLSPRICLASTRLGPRFHKDPADQIIVATARVHALTLVTADERIARAGVVAVI